MHELNSNLATSDHLNPRRHAVHITANAQLPLSNESCILLVRLITKTVCNFAEMRPTAPGVPLRHLPNEDEAEEETTCVQSDWAWEESRWTQEFALWTGRVQSVWEASW